MLSWNICYITLFDQDSTFQQSFGKVLNIFGANLTEQKFCKLLWLQYIYISHFDHCVRRGRDF